MSNVKIYTAASEDLSPLIHGEGFCVDMVRYSDYAALEAKCAELAAENAGLKAAITAVNKTSEECELNGDELKYVVDPSEFDALTDLLDETPATDAFLAEVMAQGVEAFVMDFTEPAVMNNGTFYNEDLVEASNEFAAQLRKGAAL